MNADWKMEQQRLCAALPQNVRCFVRVCRTDDAMWISDLPRHLQDVQETEKRLQAEGFICRMDEDARLWHMDFSLPRWQQLLLPLPKQAQFPDQERYHAAYALCRLWLLHPCPLHEQAMPLVRRVAKLCCEPEEHMLRAIPALHETAAMHLRMGIPCAYDAGRLLCGWLNER